jgi:hypothetical protein
LQINVNPPGLMKTHDEFRETHIWPFYLHKKLKTESLTNLAIPGASNSYITRSTLEFFIEQLKKNQTISSYIALIQWSALHRYEVYDSELREYVCVYSPNNPTVPPVDKDAHTRYSYRLLEHPKTYTDVWYTQLVCLDSFFKMHNIKYIFATMNEEVLPDGYLKSFNWLGSTAKDNCILNTDKFRYPSKHPNLIGHEMITERLYNRLTELYNL